MNSSGTISSSALSRPMYSSGTIRPMIISKLRLTPGTIKLPSWATSSVARAMISPTRWRSWNAWLLPSRLAYSSARASAVTRAATCSPAIVPVSIESPSVISSARMPSAISSRPFGAVGRAISSAARPIITGAPAYTNQASV